ncbi:hypothetical protein D5086_002274 [Populus alba]|uniref:Uncharacterized protein n=1 Tax=Populus alba TaxID=43335 RepID=A0ACC4D1X0_POPAL
MQSLNFPKQIYNNNIPTPQKAKHFLFRNRRDQTPRFPTLLLAAEHDLALKDKENKGGAVVPLPEGLRREVMPRHVAVIMDGNAKWARQQGFSAASAGHEAGGRSLRELIKSCCILVVISSQILEMEVVFLLSLFERMLQSELDYFMRKGIRVSTIGDSSRLPEPLKKLVSDVEEKTRDNCRLHLILAISYSGKYDVTQACKSIAHKVKDGIVQLEDIDESLLEQELETNCSQYPCPDLLIRTSGELRISNFLLWQLAYTELFFAEALWPDFGKAEFIEALTSYQQRQRRYGGRHS